MTNQQSLHLGRLVLLNMETLNSDLGCGIMMRIPATITAIILLRIS